MSVMSWKAAVVAKFRSLNDADFHDIVDNSFSLFRLLLLQPGPCIYPLSSSLGPQWLLIHTQCVISTLIGFFRPRVSARGAAFPVVLFLKLHFKSTRSWLVG